MADEKPRKPLFWVGSCRQDLRAFPEDVKDVVGYALHLAQTGKKHAQAKHGITTPQRELDLVRARLRRAEIDHEKHVKK